MLPVHCIGLNVGVDEPSGAEKHHLLAAADGNTDLIAVAIKIGDLPQVTECRLRSGLQLTDIQRPLHGRNGARQEKMI
jgi:hypothetical protein